MKKTILMIFFVLLWTISSSMAADPVKAKAAATPAKAKAAAKPAKAEAAAKPQEGPLTVGVIAKDFKLKDTLGNELTLASPEWKGKVIMFIAMPLDELKTNAAISEAIAKDDSIGKADTYAGSAIFSKPPAVYKAQLRAAQRKTGKFYLMDNDDAVLKLWGLKEKTSTVIVLDKQRVCRYINAGKVPDEKIPDLLKLIKTLQAK
jgi:predicted transcriptional regulator